MKTKNLNFLQKFLLNSAITIFLTALAISIIVLKNIEEYILSSHSHIVSDTLYKAIGHHLELENFNIPFSENIKVKLAELITPIITHSEINAINFLNLEGNILYSSPETSNIENTISAEELSRVINGYILHKVIHLNYPQGTDKTTNIKTLELLNVYYPIFDKNGKTIGIFEIYIKLANLKNEILKLRITTISIVIICSLLFYGLLFNIAKNASKTIKNQTKQLIDDFTETTTILSELIEMRDCYTGQHAKKIKNIANIIGYKMGLSPNAIEDLKLASSLHDIGKIGVGDSILNKRYPLTEEEFKEIKKHPITGANVIKNIVRLKSISKTILYHHERFDGKGYPFGLKSKEIPLSSRIISVIDSYDAMTSNRPYRRALPTKKALSILNSEKGKQFDPRVVEAFIDSLDKIL